MAHVIVVLTYIRNPSPWSAIGIFVTVDVYMNWKSIAYNIKWLWIAFAEQCPKTFLVCLQIKNHYAGNLWIGNDTQSSLLNDLLSGVPDYFGRNKISSGGDLSHYSSASLY